MKRSRSSSAPKSGKKLRLVSRATWNTPIVHNKSNTAVQFPREFGPVALQKNIFDFIRKFPEYLSVCSTYSGVGIEKVLEKDSASRTIQVLADFNSNINGSQGVFFKIFFDVDQKYLKSNQPYDNSLNVELEIYERVINPLLFNYTTPHLLAFYGVVSHCTVQQLKDYLPKQSQKNQLEDAVAYIKKVNNPKYDMHRMYMIALERTRKGAFTLENTPNDLASSPDYWTNVLFQIVWTLCCFRDAGLIHNDLHSGNVWVTPLPYYQQVDKTYFVSRSEIYVQNQSPVLVQLYDFDRSAKEARPNNPLFNFEIENGLSEIGDCDEYHFCNEYDEKIDITRLLYYLCKYFPGCHSVVKQFADVDYLIKLGYDRKAGKEKPYVGEYVHFGVPCRLLPNGDCEYERPTNDQVKPLREILEILGVKYRSKIMKSLKQCLNLEYEYNQVYALPNSWRDNYRSVESAFSTIRN